MNVTLATVPATHINNLSARELYARLNGQSL